jgi:hypothetical protein
MPVPDKDRGVPGKRTGDYNPEGPEPLQIAIRARHPWYPPRVLPFDSLSLVLTGLDDLPIIEVVLIHIVLQWPEWQHYC